MDFLCFNLADERFANTPIGPRASTSASTTPGPTPLPVICDNCRHTGLLGEGPFAAIRDIMDFMPVPRRAHANGWTPEHQRAFIAALAITGSARQAARHVGRATFGAEQLRTAKGGKSFATAWDSALDLARDREFARLQENLGELTARTEAEHAQAKADGRLVPADEHDDGEEDEESYEQRRNEISERLIQKLKRVRRNLVRDEIIPDPAKRAAWILLNGPDEIDEIEGGSATPVRHPRETGDPASLAKEPSPSPKLEDKPRPRLRKL